MTTLPPALPGLSAGGDLQRELNCEGLRAVEAKGGKGGKGGKEMGGRRTAVAVEETALCAPCTCRTAVADADDRPRAGGRPDMPGKAADFL